MKYIITESKLQEVALLWMNKSFHPDKLEVFTSEDFPNSIFYKKDGIVVMEQDLVHKDFWFDYDKICSFFNKFFNIDNKEINTILRLWLNETLKLYGYEPFCMGKHWSRWEILSN